MIYKSLKVALLGCTIFCSTNAFSSERDDTLDLSLNELMNTQIYSASKRPEKLSEVPAAAFVLSSEDIANSGVTSIPEALRLVPGVQVAQSNSNNWAISIRGSNRQFSNKLLVMIDGRTVYTPLFSGVFWDAQDYILEDIDRIEVIRGPGGTLWGANAVNGVINIITKEARKTQGSYVSATVGTHDDILEFRQGGKTEGGNYYRAYGKVKDISEFIDSERDRSSNDDWQQGRAGFRFDFRDGSYDPVTLQGDVYSGKREARFKVPNTTAPFFTEEAFGEHHTGANVLLKWNKPLTNEIDSDISAYIDYVHRDSDFLVEQERVTFNLDFQVLYNEGIHNIIAGAETRFIKDNLNNTAALAYQPESTSTKILSAFMQDRLELIENTLFLTLGTKVDYNEYTDVEFQPNVRALWQISENHSVWSSVSRAVRTPSRAENSLSNLTIYEPGVLSPGILSSIGNESYESEKLTAYEIGYRGDLSENLFMDATAFYNDYSDLRTLEAVGATRVTGNNGYGESYGVEVSFTAGLSKKHQLQRHH